MKAIKILLLISVFMIPLVLVQCSEEADDPVVYYSISGVVSLPDAELADGALVYLTESATSTSYIAVTVADAVGAYSFANLEPGDYYVFANYNTFNTNSGGRLDGLKFSSTNEMVSIVNANATHNVTLSNSSAAGININTSETGTWEVDRAHSEVVFEFPYREFNGTFSGRFTSYDFTFDFNDSDLANSSITAEVNLLTIATGQPGRDGFFTTEASDGTDSLNANNEIVEYYSSGCLGNTIGATTGRGTETVLTANTTATWTSTSIELYGDGYKAKGNFTFNGKSSEVVVFFRFIDGYESDGRQFSSFEAMFEFKASSDHGLTASQVDDVVTVWATCQVREKA